MSVTYTDSGAKFSLDGRYRFTLWRRWSDGPTLLVIGLNPSTADETENDPTVRRCVDFARRWGYGRLEMRNVFAYRATDPRELRRQCDRWRDFWLDHAQTTVDQAWMTIANGGAVLAAWGACLYDKYHADEFRKLLSWRCVGVACLGLTATGQPCHPLYVRADTEPVAYLGDGGRLVTAFRPLQLVLSGGSC